MVCGVDVLLVDVCPVFLKPELVKEDDVLLMVVGEEVLVIDIGVVDDSVDVTEIC